MSLTAMPDREVVTRRNLPHWYVPGAAHFLTYRLAGTIPVHAIRMMRERREQKLKLAAIEATTERTPRHREIAHKQFFAEYDRYLDSHRSIDWLGNSSVASAVRENLYFHHGSRYRLVSYCIMPNHMHVVLFPIRRSEIVRSERAGSCDGDESSDSEGPLSEITHGLKSFTAKRINTILKRTGQVWQHESYDHWVRDEEELERIVFYVRGNPLAAGLVERAENWVFSSCADRHQFDADLTGWISDECAESCRSRYCS